MMANQESEFRQGDWVESVNALGKGLGDDGRSMISLDPNVVMAAAVENTGLSDFGDDDWFVEGHHLERERLLQTRQKRVGAVDSLVLLRVGDAENDDDDVGLLGRGHGGGDP